MLPEQFQEEPSDNEVLLSMYEQKVAVKKAREALFHGMNAWRLREQLLLAHDVLEEWLSIPFLACEQGLGPEERERWEARLRTQLSGILRAQATCLICGERFSAWEDQPIHCYFEVRANPT